MEGLGFITSDSQNTPELWDPQGSTCENLWWWKSYEPMLSLPLFHRGNKNPLFSLPGSLFSWNLKNLISVRPLSLAISECEPGNAPRLNRKLWRSGRRDAGAASKSQSSAKGDSQQHLWQTSPKEQTQAESLFLGECHPLAETGTHWWHLLQSPDAAWEVSGYGSVLCHGFSHWLLACRGVPGLAKPKSSEA